ncbi:methylamine utilization protein [Rheinheimera sp. UJ51]|uniref:methylamine utilization protein n=1 Tax=Rheinheimera sp. UJ51 TaxID=2892446 RepID=UPI001E2F17FA|nr:methylamine utilization protein [Rheinheimera sp. UJ51]MCC5450220.1 methylamine utilization protein [Rheinheimera sp. UJ51]
MKFHSSLLGILMLVFASFASQGQGVSITVLDQTNKPLADAVIEIISPDFKTTTAAKIAHVAQEDLVFVPFVTAIQQGNLIDFPNRDKTRHHVYSFSSAKTFEIQLYSGKPEAPVQFDEPGIVVLGCNIHDYMLAYIYIGENPLLLVTDSEGKVNFPEVPKGELRLKIWHPWQVEALAEQVVTPDETNHLTFSLAIEDNEKPRAPQRGFGS